jgi:dTDP-4-amino-4,6-dideoxygalactose transaminase
MGRIYLSPPDLDGREKELLLDALESNWITTLGPHVTAFEHEVCAKVGVHSGVAVSSGTAALHLALQLLGVGRDDDVICSDLTFAATANAITYCGASPVFVDSNAATWNMDPALLEEELRMCARRGRMPKAVVVVDLYGQCADYDSILTICADFDVPVIEDAAEALGATHKTRAAGSLGKIGILSFNGNKIITTSGGGMLLSDDRGLVDRARFLATPARDPAPHYQHSTIGYNYRLSNLLAAVGRGQLESLDRKIARRREINQFYRNALGELPGIEFMPEAPYGRSNCWLTVITVVSTISQVTNRDLRLRLEAVNIESRPVWKPMHLQPVFKHCRFRGNGFGREVFAHGLCLPSGSSLSEEDLNRIVSVIRQAYQARTNLTAVTEHISTIRSDHPAIDKMVTVQPITDNPALAAPASRIEKGLTENREREKSSPG